LRDLLLQKAGRHLDQTVRGQVDGELEALLNPRRAGPPATADDRPREFRVLARRRLDNLTASPDQPLAFLQETVALTQASTLACALAHKERGPGRLDELWARLAG